MALADEAGSYDPGIFVLKIQRKDTVWYDLVLVSVVITAYYTAVWYNLLLVSVLIEFIITAMPGYSPWMLHVVPLYLLHFGARSIYNVKI